MRWTGRGDRGASKQIERTLAGGKTAGFRTGRDARYNRVVVPWWRRDCNPGGSHCGGVQNTKFSV